MDALISKNAPSSGYRKAIRLLFPGLIVLAFFMWVIRSCFGEPYPGLFMPAFKGNGLHIVAGNQAEFIVPSLTVSFADHTTDEVSVTKLFGDGPVSSRRAMLYMIAPNPDPLETPTGLKKVLRQWITQHLTWYREPGLNTTWTVKDDVRAYLHRRLVALYPAKVPSSLTISINKWRYSTEDFHKISTALDSQKTITFDEGI